MVPIPPTATAWREKRGRRGRREISSGPSIPGKLSYLSCHTRRIPQEFSVGLAKPL